MVRYPYLLNGPCDLVPTTPQDVPGGDDELNSRRNRMWHAIGIEVGTYYSA